MTELSILNTVITKLEAAAANIITTEDIFMEAYAAVSQAGGRANLSDMRAYLSDLDRAEFDAAALKLEDERKLVLYDLDDPCDRTPEVMAGGVEVCPGLYRQICYMK